MNNVNIAYTYKMNILRLASGELAAANLAVWHILSEWSWKASMNGVNISLKVNSDKSPSESC